MQTTPMRKAGAPAARARGRLRLREKLIHAAPALLVALPLVWLVAVPLAILAVSAFKPTGFLLDPGLTLSHVATTWGDGDLWRLVGRTLIFSAGSALMALVLGTALAFAVERTDLAGREFVRAALIVPMAIPPFLLAIGWVMLLSPRTGSINVALMGLLGLTSAPFDIYSMAGMIFVEGLALTPSAFLIIAPSLRNFDAAMEEAAQMSGAGAASAFFRIALPLLAPALAGTFVFLLIVGIMVFDIPGVIGLPARLPLLSTYIYDLAHHGPMGLPEYGAMSAVALLTIAALVALCLAYQRLMAHADRFVTVKGKAFRPAPHRLGRLGPWVIAAVVVYLSVAVALPMGSLIWTSLMPYARPVSWEALGSLTLANHAAFLTDPTLPKAALHTLVIAVVAATVVAVLSLLVSWVVVKTRAPGRWLIDTLAFMPLAMPGVLMGTALIYVYLSVKVAPIYGSIWIIAIAHVTVYLSFATRATNATMAQLHIELEEAARMSGAGRLTTIARIVAPLALPALGAVWLWVFSHSARELSSALMLQGVDNATLPTLLYAYWTQGQPTRTAAVGVWLIAGMIAVLALARVIERLSARART